MKNLSLLIIAITILSACHHSDKQLNETINNADSVAINYFTGDGKVDSVTTVKIIRDKSTIAQLTGFITASLTGIKSNCGYDGSIHFYKNDNVVQDIKFRMNDDHCMQFTFVEGQNLTATTLSSDARLLLESLYK